MQAGQQLVMHLIPFVDGRRQRFDGLGCQASFHDAKTKTEESACQGMVWGILIGALSPMR